MQVRQRLVTQAVKEMLIVGCEHPFDVMRPPDDDEGNTVLPPYGIIIPRPKGVFSGPPYSTIPWGDAQIEYRIKSIGKRYDQAEGLADVIREVMLGINDDGSFTYELEMEDQKCMDRRPGQDSPGAPTSEGNMVEVDDSYIISVTVS